MFAWGAPKRTRASMPVRIFKSLRRRRYGASSGHASSEMINIPGNLPLVAGGEIVIPGAGFAGGKLVIDEAPLVTMSVCACLHCDGSPFPAADHCSPLPKSGCDVSAPSKAGCYTKHVADCKCGGYTQVPLATNASGSGGAALRGTTGGVGQALLRDLESMFEWQGGSGGAVVPAGCKDVVGWRSSNNAHCADYIARRWCTASGGYGDGWSLPMGSFKDWAGTGGLDATRACCACGKGGHNASASAATGGARGPLPRPAQLSNCTHGRTWSSCAREKEATCAAPAPTADLAAPCAAAACRCPPGTVYEEESKLRCVLHSQCPAHSQAWIREDAAVDGCVPHVGAGIDRALRLGASLWAGVRDCKRKCDQKCGCAAFVHRADARKCELMSTASFSATKLSAEGPATHTVYTCPADAKEHGEGAVDCDERTVLHFEGTELFLLAGMFAVAIALLASSKKAAARRRRYHDNTINFAQSGTPSKSKRQRGAHETDGLLHVDM